MNFYAAGGRFGAYLVVFEFHQRPRCQDFAGGRDACRNLDAACAKAHEFGESLEPLSYRAPRTYRCATRPDAEAQPYNAVFHANAKIAFEAVDTQDALDPDEQATCKASGAASDLDNCRGGAGA